MQKGGTTKRDMNQKGRSKEINNGSAAVPQHMKPGSEEDIVVSHDS